MGSLKKVGTRKQNQLLFLNSLTHTNFCLKPLCHGWKRRQRWWISPRAADLSSAGALAQIYHGGSLEVHMFLCWWFLIDGWVEVSLGPFPWQKQQPGENSSDASSKGEEHRDDDGVYPLPLNLIAEDCSHGSLPPQRKTPQYMQDPDLCKLNRSLEVFKKMESQEHMTVSLPRPGSTAGFVLFHAARCFEMLHKKTQPMIWKFGITHCPHFRWHHRPYGYRYAPEKYEGMLIVYGASQPWGPSFLEAHPIQRYGSCLAIQFGDSSSKQPIACQWHFVRLNSYILGWPLRLKPNFSEVGRGAKMFFMAESLMERTSRMRVLFSHTLCIDLSKHLPLCRLCPHDVMGSGQFEFQLVMCVFTHLALQRVGKKSDCSK